jgi:LacI family transcriptional regulator
MPAQAGSVRVALVLPTEFAYARDVLHGIVAATRERNMYGIGDDGSRGGGAGSAGAGGATKTVAPRPDHRPWLFRVFRGIYTSSRFLGRWFRDWEPDGIICQIQEDRMTKFYRGTGKPVVELFERDSRAHFPRILPDDQATGRLGADHFVRRGFRHFGFFGDGSMAWVRERETGFRREIERVFADRAESGAGNPEFTFSSFEHDKRPVAAALAGTLQRRLSAAMGEWLVSLPKPERGLHVPDDVAVLGIDNDELLCEISHPPLSSIKIGGEQMGRQAVALLDRLLAGERNVPEAERVAPLGIVTRQSSDVLAVDDPEVAAAVRHIRQHAFEGLSVKQMLDAVAVNRRTLERRFVKVLGHTPLEEIRRVRLDRVKALLQTDLPIYEVAVRTGFATPEYLATSFLQSTGMTPTDYRRKFAPRGRWHNPPT